MTLVSVVIPTRNSGRTLHACLQSIRGQTWHAVEVVVVDNDSTDETIAIARRASDRVLAVRPERSAQRNAGAQASSGDLLLFVDSDMVLDRRVVEEAVRASDTADAVVVPETSFGTGFWARCKRLERNCYVGDASIEAARCFRRNVFFAVGGYDEALRATEDWDLHARVLATGARLGRVEAFIHHDEGRLRLRALIRKKYSYGKGSRGYASRHPEPFRAQRRLLRRFLHHRGTFFSEPLTGLGVLVMKMLEFAAFGAGLAAATAMSHRMQRGRPA